MLEMTRAEYARHRGVSRSAITKTVKAGRIALTASGKIDVAAADRALGETHKRIDIPRDESSGISKLTEHKADRESYLARLAELDYLERVGKLLHVEDVTRAMESCAELIARDFDRLPALADDLASIFEREGVPGLRKALKHTVYGMRADMAAKMRLLGDEEATAGT